MREKWAATDREHTTHGERKSETLFLWEMACALSQSSDNSVDRLIPRLIIHSYRLVQSCRQLCSRQRVNAVVPLSVGSRCDPFPRCHRLYCFDINYLSLYHILLFYKVDPWKQPAESGWMLSSDVPAASDSARTESTEERLLLGAYGAAGPSRVRNELSVVISLS